MCNVHRCYARTVPRHHGKLTLTHHTVLVTVVTIVVIIVIVAHLNFHLSLLTFPFFAHLTYSYLLFPFTFPFLFVFILYFPYSPFIHPSFPFQFSLQDWRAKDAALHLVLAVAVMSTSSTMGAGRYTFKFILFHIYKA